MSSALLFTILDTVEVETPDSLAISLILTIADFCTTLPAAMLTRYALLAPPFQVVPPLPGMSCTDFAVPDFRVRTISIFSHYKGMKGNSKDCILHI